MTLKGKGVEDQMTLGSYTSKAACEMVRSHATSNKNDLACVGIQFLDSKPDKSNPINKWDRNRERSLSEFKLKFWV